MLVRVVAGSAVFAEKGPVRFIKRGLRRGGLGDGGEEEEKGKWDKGMGRAAIPPGSD